jgi:hypothetical protein
MSRSIVLKQTDEFQYILVKIDKEECEEIQALMRLKATESDKYPFINDVEGCAHVTEVTNALLEPYISLFKEWSFKHEDYPNRITKLKEYTCYANPNKKPLPNQIIHEDRTSAFECACKCIGAEYFYIEKRPYIPLGRGIYPQFKIATNHPLTIERLNDYLNAQNHDTNNNNNSEVHPEGKNE